MREVLRFVRGAVADKEGAIPALTRFCITGGRIQGSNGRIVIDAPLPELEDISALVPADRFLNAIDACDSEPDEISVTDAGRLMIKRGKFRASLPISPVDNFPRAEPTPGIRNTAWTETLPLVLSTLRPFVGEDAMRPWCLTIVADGSRAYATNSNMIGSIPCKHTFQLPVFLIDELLRIGTAADALVQDQSSITFHYGTSWLRSQLIVEEYPLKTAEKIIAWDDKLKKIPPDLVQKVESLIPFCANPKYPLVFFTDKGISTEPGETQAEIEGSSWPRLSFDARNLIPLLRAAQRFGIDAEGGRGLIEGDHGFRGAIMGRKIT